MRRARPVESIRAHPRVTGILLALVLAVATAVVSSQVDADRDTDRAIDRCTPGAAAPTSCGKAPALRGIASWLGTPGGSSVELSDLRGKVVLVHFFAYSCLGCRRTLPQVRAWSERYRASGLEVIGVHAPQLAFERDAGNVAAAMAAARVPYPVALDNAGATARAYRARERPATYLVDAEGTVRAITLGEGGYERTEKQIRTLLGRADPGARLPDPVGVRAVPGVSPGTTPPIRFTYARNTRYRGTPSLRLGRPQAYFASREQPTDSYGLDGSLQVEREYVQASGDRSQIVLSYRAAKVYAVLGRGAKVTGRASVRVTSPGRAPRRFAIPARPGLVRLVDEPEARRTVVTLTLSEGARAYAVDFG